MTSSFLLIKKKCDNFDIGLGHLKYSHNVQQVGNLNRNNMYFFFQSFSRLRELWEMSNYCLFVGKNK